MIFVGGFLLFLLALIIIFGFMIEWSKESAKKAKAREDLQKQVESALEKKDLNALRRIRIINAKGLEALDSGLGGRLDEVIDQISIEEDDARKYGTSNE